MQHHEINGQPAVRLQFQRHRNRLIQVGTGHTLAGLLQSPRDADSPTDYIIHVGVGERSAAVGFVAESEHMVGDGVCAHGHVPIARLMRHVDDFLRTFHLRGHHVFGAVCHKRGNGIGLGIQRVEVEIGQAEQFRIDVDARRTMDWYPSCAPTSAKSCAARNPNECRGEYTIGLSNTWNATSGS